MNPGSVDHLLLSSPNAVVSARVRGQLEAAGVRTRASRLGISIPCPTEDTGALLESISVMLSDFERRDMRIAKLHSSNDNSSLQHAVFRARSLDDMLRETRSAWFEDILARNSLSI